MVDEVAEHIVEARATLDHEDATAIRALLERVGDPWAIAAEAGAAPVWTGVRMPNRVTDGADAFVPWLLLLGGLVLVVGWLLGAALLWASPTWRVRDKVLGTLVWPGGLAAVLVLLGGVIAVAPSGSGSHSCSFSAHAVAHTCNATGTSFVLWIVPLLILVAAPIVAAPVVTAVHLERMRRRQRFGWA